MTEKYRTPRLSISAVGALTGALLALSAMSSLANSPGAATGLAPHDSAISSFETEREQFILAKAALAEGDLDRFNAIRKSLHQYPLSDYLEFARLQQAWKSTRPGVAEIDELNAFEQRTGDASLTGRLTRTLQKRFAETEQWQIFLGISKSRLASRMPCTRLKARSETGQLTGFDDEALEIWVQPRDHDEPCASVLAALENDHTPPVSMIWEKIYRAMDANKPQYAESQLGLLASADRKLVKRWIDAAKAPDVFLNSGELDANTVLNRRIVADLIVDWSRIDTPAAIEHWLKIRDNYTFYADRYYDTHRAIAMRAAYRRLPEAHGWLNGIDARKDDLELKEWRVRTALLAEDWEAVHRSIMALPLVEQVEDHWAYWEARALEMLGRKDEAMGIYTELSELQSYYGFLSADRLQIEYSIYDEPIAPEPGLLTQLASDPTLIRAREFHHVDLTSESRREWNNWMKGKSAEELSAAAVLASEWSLHDRAIFTAGQADTRRAISLRFPVLYQSDVAKASAEHSIDPAWIFGVMRRESAYIRDIRSGVGAVGLMQLMPRTAKYVASLQGQKNWRGDLTDSATNIGFGTFYLRHVMDKFDDHQVLATASYNAGPHRVDKWLRESGVDADIWIDTIPFTETRRYVRAVMAYAAIYEYHLTGKSQRLSTKLLPIPAAPEA